MTDPRIEQKAREVAFKLDGTPGVIDRDGELNEDMAAGIVAAALQSAVAKEREECAKLAATMIGAKRREIAAAIRARGQKETA